MVTAAYQYTTPVISANGRRCHIAGSYGGYTKGCGLLAEGLWEAMFTTSKNDHEIRLVNEGY